MTEEGQQIKTHVSVISHDIETWTSTWDDRRRQHNQRLDYRWFDPLISFLPLTSVGPGIWFFGIVNHGVSDATDVCFFFCFFFFLYCVTHCGVKLTMKGCSLSGINFLPTVATGARSKEAVIDQKKRKGGGGLVDFSNIRSWFSDLVWCLKVYQDRLVIQSVVEIEECVWYWDLRRWRRSKDLQTDHIHKWGGLAKGHWCYQACELTFLGKASTVWRYDNAITKADGIDVMSFMRLMWCLMIRWSEFWKKVFYEVFERGIE